MVYRDNKLVGYAEGNEESIVISRLFKNVPQIMHPLKDYFGGRRIDLLDLVNFKDYGISFDVEYADTRSRKEKIQAKVDRLFG